MLSDCPVVPSSTSSCATRPRRRTECTWMPPAPTPPRAPSTTVVVVGSADHSAEAVAIRWTVSMAVPDGASTFWSWWSSITSALSKYGAASSAKRIMSTAPMAKFGAITALALEAAKRSRKASRSASPNPVVPTTACTPWSAHQLTFSRAASTTVKSTATSAPASASASALRAICMLDASTPNWRRSMPAWSGSTAATSSSCGSPSTARHTVAPMRPAAPKTATLIIDAAYRRRCRGRSDRDRRVRRPDDGEGARAVAQHAVDDPGHVGRGDRLDLLHDPVETRDLAHGQLTPADPVHAAGRALERQRQRTGEVALGPGQLTLGDAAVGHQPVELGAHDVERLVHTLRRGRAVHGEGAGLLERAAVGEHRVGEAALLAHLLEQPRAHAAAQHLVDDRQREAGRVVPPERAGAEHHVRLLQRTVDAREAVDVGGVGAAGAPGAWTTVGRLRGCDTRHHVVVVDVAGRRHHDVRRLVVVGVVRGDLVAGDGLDGGLAPRDLTTEGVAREQRAGEHVVDEVVGRVVAHPDLLEDHLALRFDLVGAQRGRPHDVGEDVEREREVPVGHAHVVRGDLLAGERVHVAPARLDGFGDLRRVARLGALEQQVLEEVARARDRLRLVARPRAHPEPDRRRPEAGKVLRDDAQPGLELRAADAGGVVDHRSRHRRAPVTA